MKTFSAIAVAASLALGSIVAMAPAADAATMAKKPAPAAACVATKAKPCPVKHVAKKPMHKKHKVVAKKTDTKAPAKKAS
jgi:hypothetical protein